MNAKKSAIKALQEEFTSLWPDPNILEWKDAIEAIGVLDEPEKSKIRIKELVEFRENLLKALANGINNKTCSMTTQEVASTNPTSNVDYTITPNNTKKMQTGTSPMELKCIIDYRQQVENVLFTLMGDIVSIKRSGQSTSGQSVNEVTIDSNYNTKLNTKKSLNRQQVIAVLKSIFAINFYLKPFPSNLPKSSEYSDLQRFFALQTVLNIAYIPEQLRLYTNILSKRRDGVTLSSPSHSGELAKLSSFGSFGRLNLSRRSSITIPNVSVMDLMVSSDANSQPSSPSRIVKDRTTLSEIDFISLIKCTEVDAYCTQASFVRWAKGEQLKADFEAPYIDCILEQLCFAYKHYDDDSAVFKYISRALITYDELKSKFPNAVLLLLKSSCVGAAQHKNTNANTNKIVIDLRNYIYDKKTSEFKSSNDLISKYRSCKPEQVEIANAIKSLTGDTYTNDFVFSGQTQTGASPIIPKYSMYNGRRYRVNIGKRGGKFIYIRSLDKKIYISL